MGTFNSMFLKRAPGFHQSKGAVLIVSMILLLIMTLIGVSAMDSALLQSQMARNSLVAQKLYQASRGEVEAQYRKLHGTAYQKSLTNSTNKVNGHPSVIQSGSKVATHGTNHEVNQSTVLSFTADSTPPGYSLGLFVGKRFEINAISEKAGTGMNNDQTQGLFRPAPIR